MHGTQQKCLVALFAPAILKQLRLVSRRSFPFAPTVNGAVGQVRPSQFEAAQMTQLLDRRLSGKRHAAGARDWAPQ